MNPQRLAAGSFFALAVQLIPPEQQLPLLNIHK
jgi:hypothetical protein